MNAVVVGVRQPVENRYAVDAGAIGAGDVQGPGGLSLMVTSRIRIVRHPQLRGIPVGNKRLTDPLLIVRCSYRSGRREPIVIVHIQIHRLSFHVTW